MSEMSRTFNFDDFEAQIADALDENEQVMRPIIKMRRPGDIGAVAMRPSYLRGNTAGSPDLPPEAA